MPNRLADADSPYLQQHKDNPVDWWPWCDEAFERANHFYKHRLLLMSLVPCYGREGL